jgi:hypothetical protein
MAFFPDEAELPREHNGEDEEPEEVKVLYATADGWLVLPDLEMLANLEKLDVMSNEKISTAVADLIAKQVPGSWMRLPQATLVVLGKEAVKTQFGVPVD